MKERARLRGRFGADMRAAPLRVLVDCQRQAADRFRVVRRGQQDGRDAPSVRAVALEHAADVLRHPFGAGQIGLVDHDNIRGFEHAGFHRLHLVAGLRPHRQNERIDERTRAVFDLPRADRFEQDLREAVRFDRGQYVREVVGKAVGRPAAG